MNKKAHVFIRIKPRFVRAFLGYLSAWANLRDRKMNSSPTTIDDKEALKKPLTNPPVKKIDLHFPLGLEVTARNMKGVTVKDAIDAIHKQFKKKARLSFPFHNCTSWTFQSIMREAN